jgi:hypothetical protein
MRIGAVTVSPTVMPAGNKPDGDLIEAQTAQAIIPPPELHVGALEARAQ